MAETLEITGTFLRERHRFANDDGDVVIADVFCNSDINGEVTIKGQADDGELARDNEYRFLGRWSTYKNKRTGETEKQFHFDSFVAATPHSREGVIGYIVAAGEGHGLGHARAAKLWSLYGEQAVAMLREQPAEVAAALVDAKLRIDAASVQAVADTLVRQQSLESCTLDLMELLRGRGFPKATARLAIHEWGNRSALIVRRDPYQLMKFRACGFKRCDALYLALKLPPSRLKRQALCAWYALASNTEGHTWFPIQLAEAGIKSSVSAAELRPGRAIELAVRGRACAELRTDGAAGPIQSVSEPTPATRRWLAERRKADNEQELAELVAEAMAEPHRWPSADVVQGIDDHQRTKLAEALQGTVAILGGSPGTGKTYTAAALVKHLVASVGANMIGIGAPTGKAAVRMTESLAAYGLPVRARTWHSMLRGGPDGSFMFDRSHPLPYSVLIGDETSMNDTDLMASVFRARAKGCHVLLVGDVNQLPPVGHGAPLRDLIAAGLPYGELREIKRNSGGIVEACAAIRDGQKWGEGDNLKIVDDCEGPDIQRLCMLEEVNLAAGAGFNPIWDCQVVVPVNAKSPLARKALNKELQAALNSNPQVGESPFRLGDKIVNTKNGFFDSADLSNLAGSDDEDVQTNDRGQVYVANGELAEVIHAEDRLTIARLSNPARTIRIPRGRVQQNETDSDTPDPLANEREDNSPKTGCTWDLGYALSVHKSQGSEWPVVIVLIDEYPGAKMVCSREWLYTAISRAKQRCVLIGKKLVADAFCRRVAIGKRKTFLRERVLMERARIVLERM